MPAPHPAAAAPEAGAEQRRRLFRDHNVHYEVGDKARGLRAGATGAFPLLVRPVGLADAIGRGLPLRKLPASFAVPTTKRRRFSSAAEFT